MLDLKTSKPQNLKTSTLFYYFSRIYNLLDPPFLKPVEHSKIYSFSLLINYIIFKSLMGMLLILPFVSVCSAKPIINEPNQVEEESVERTEPAPLLSPPATKSDNTKKVQSSAQAQSKPLPCEGITDNLVSPRVQDFLTCEVVQILAKPEQVQSFQIEPEPDTSKPKKERIGNYPIQEGGAGPVLKPDDKRLKTLQSLIFSEHSYVFGAEKRCAFRPKMGLHFIKGRETVDVLFSFSCDLWLFIHKSYEDKGKLEDFDPISSELEEFYESLFPVNNNIPTQN